ncbi:MAG: EF-P lysine aminoacylase EpmA [Planctomycetota bacterium]
MPPIEVLRRRAELLASTREFFAARDVLEVDTPLLGEGVVVEEHIDPIPCQVQVEGSNATRYLLTSPEGPMKRLLAAGSGPIYQFAHAFRDGEVGRRHAPEFTMLEWYRPGFDHHQLMDEVEAFVRTLIPEVGDNVFERKTYREVFLESASIDPFATSIEEIRRTCERLAIAVPADFENGSLDDALDLLLVCHIEPQLGAEVPLFVHDYPESQAALAQIHEDAAGRRVAERFELYIQGIELANGYHELLDASEQRRRFEAANQARVENDRPALPLDADLLEALEIGMPACAGVALGFDRLVMLATGATDIRDVRFG